MLNKLPEIAVAIVFTIVVFAVVNVIGDLAVQPQMASAPAMTQDSEGDTAQAEESEAPEPQEAAAPAMAEPQADEPQAAAAEVAEQAQAMAETAEADAPAAAEEAAPAVVAAAGGDTDAGQKLFRRKCKACHTFEKGGKNLTGPNLWGVIGRERGSIDGFRYSVAMKNTGGTWTADEIKSFIAGPRSYLPDTKMTFAGLKKESDRDDIVTFLKSLQD